MNERIQKLAEQANAWYPDGYPSGEGGDAAWKDLVIFSKQDLEKFAELIVRECTQLMQARKYADPDDSAEHYVNQGLATGVSLIKQHFGVK